MLFSHQASGPLSGVNSRHVLAPSPSCPHRIIHLRRFHVREVEEPEQLFRFRLQWSKQHPHLCHGNSLSAIPNQDSTSWVMIPSISAPRVGSWIHLKPLFKSLVWISQYPPYRSEPIDTDRQNGISCLCRITAVWYDVCHKHIYNFFGLELLVFHLPKSRGKPATCRLPVFVLQKTTWQPCFIDGGKKKSVIILKCCDVWCTAKAPQAASKWIVINAVVCLHFTLVHPYHHLRRSWKTPQPLKINKGFNVNFCV